MDIIIDKATRFRLSKEASRLGKSIEEVAAFILSKGLQTAEKEALLFYEKGLQTAPAPVVPKTFCV